MPSQNNPFWNLTSTDLVPRPTIPIKYTQVGCWNVTQGKQGSDRFVALKHASGNGRFHVVGPVDNAAFLEQMIRLHVDTIHCIGGCLWNKLPHLLMLVSDAKKRYLLYYSYAKEREFTCNGKAEMAESMGNIISAVSRDDTKFTVELSASEKKQLIELPLTTFQ